MRKATPAPRLVSKLEVSTELGNFLGDTRVRLLEAIEEHGSISQAAKHVPLSYKAAWDAVDAMNNLAQFPVVERTTGGRQGGGTRLTAYGKRLIAIFRAVEDEYQRALDRLSQETDIEAESQRDFRHRLRRMNMRTSARNQFTCTVNGLREGDLDYEVQLRLDRDTQLVAAITRASAEELELAIGSEVIALVKAPSVLLTTERNRRKSPRNRLWGTVRRVDEAAVNAQVIVDIGNGKSVTAVVTQKSWRDLALNVGGSVCALIESSNIILAVID